MGVRVSGSRLASAVSNTGALGVIASVGLGEEDDSDAGLPYTERSAHGLSKMIRETKSLTKAPIAVNIMCALTNYESLVKVAVSEGVEVIISGAGLPLRLPGLVGNPDVKLIPIVSSARAAKIICRAWREKFSRRPDAFILEGPMAGGHVGFSMDDATASEEGRLDALLPELLAFAATQPDASGNPIPVIAAGGVFDGYDIARLLKLGASGVQMGTRFVCTEECDAAPAFKQLYVDSKREDVIVIKSPVGMPLRVIRNAFVDKILSGVKFDFECKYHCLATCAPAKTAYCLAKALVNAQRGVLDLGFAPCGANAYRIDRIVTVKQLIGELVDQAATILNSAPAKA